MKFNLKKKEKMIETIILSVVILICILLAVLSDVLWEGSDFANVVDSTIGRFFDIVEFFSLRYVAILESLTIIFFMWLISKALRFLISALTKIGQKSATIGIIVNSIIKYGSVMIGIFLILSAWGVDSSTLLAGAGILGLAISFGAQSLIEDVISGLFIIFEKDFQVGDIIEVDGFRGTVVAIGIRTTKIEDLTGDLKIINNSEIRGAVNTSNSLHPAICDISLSYGTDIERFERLIHEELPRLRETITDIQEGPFYKGVQQLGDSAVVLRVLARTEESKKYQVVRDLNREIKIFCDKNGFEIPFNQLVVHLEKSGSKIKAEPELPDPVFLEAAENGVKIDPTPKKPRIVRPEVKPEKTEPLRVPEEEITGKSVEEPKPVPAEIKPARTAPRPKAESVPGTESKPVVSAPKPKKPAATAAEVPVSPEPKNKTVSAPKKPPETKTEK